MPWPPWKTERTDPHPPVKVPVKPLFPPAPHLNIPPPPKPQASSSMTDQADVTHMPVNMAPYLVPDPEQRAAPMPPQNVVAASLPVAGGLRMALMDIGADVTKLLVSQGKLPEDMARTVGMEVEQLYLIMTGREADISVRVLDALSSYLGATLVVHLALPDSPPATA